jgi:histidinol-phosphate phosphatase family protein
VSGSGPTSLGTDAPPPLRRAVFVDRDGTLNPDFHYLSDPARYEFLPGVIDGLRWFRAHGYLLFCVTNQSGIGRGYFTVETLNAIHARIDERLHQAGVGLDGYYYCPHRPEEGCECRKPGTLLFRRAAEEHGIDLRASAIIGDRSLDMEVGRTLGMTSVLVPERGLETQTEAELRAQGVQPMYRAGTFRGAAILLLGNG